MTSKCLASDRLTALSVIEIQTIKLPERIREREKERETERVTQRDILAKIEELRKKWLDWTFIHRERGPGTPATPSRHDSPRAPVPRAPWCRTSNTYLDQTI